MRVYVPHFARVLHLPVPVVTSARSSTSRTPATTATEFHLKIQTYITQAGVEVVIACISSLDPHVSLLACASPANFVPVPPQHATSIVPRFGERVPKRSTMRRVHDIPLNPTPTTASAWSTQLPSRPNKRHPRTVDREYRKHSDISSALSIPTLI